MPAILENIQLACGVCKIGVYTLCMKLCCKKPPPPRPEFSAVCVGLDGAGKSTTLALLAGQTATEDIQPTTGFEIKALSFKTCILNVKEIGGGEKIRQFWKHYYKGTQAFVYIIDSACTEEDMEVNKKAFHEVVVHPDLENLPCLILANCQDKEAARTEQQLREELELEKYCGDRWWHLELCTTKDIEKARVGFDKLNSHLVGGDEKLEENGTAPEAQDINRI